MLPCSILTHVNYKVCKCNPLCFYLVTSYLFIDSSCSLLPFAIFYGCRSIIFNGSKQLAHVFLHFFIYNVMKLADEIKTFLLTFNSAALLSWKRSSRFFYVDSVTALSPQVHLCMVCVVPYLLKVTIMYPYEWLFIEEVFFVIISLTSCCIAASCYGWN